MNWRSRLGILAAAGLFLARSAAAEPLVLGYPAVLSLPEEGRGAPPPELADAVEVIRVAALEVKWEPVPLERRFERLKNGPANFCLPAVFKTPDHLGLGSFSDSYAALAPFVIVSLASKAAEIERQGTASALLADDRLTLVIFAGMSFGQFLDAHIQAAAGHVEAIYSDSADTLGMLLSGRGDYGIARKTPSVQRIEASGRSASDFAFITFPDMPQAEPVYFLCSKTVAAGTMARINHAIRQIRESQSTVAAP